MAPFLLLTFAGSWIAMWALDAGNVFPVGMMVPAAVAMGLSFASFGESRIHRTRCPEAARRLILSFQLLLLLETALVLWGGTRGAPLGFLRLAGQWLMIVWMLFVIRTYRRYPAEEFRRAGLQLGDRRAGMLLVAAFFLFIVAQPVLELILGLSHLVGEPSPVLGVEIPAAMYPLQVAVMALLAAVGTPLGSMALLFGEEYAWRGFLLEELEPLGRVPATLLIGTAWAVWHTPIILSGIHTYPPTVTGFALAWVFFTLWSFVQSYAVFRTGSIWTAAFLHGVVNGVYGLARTLVRPEDKVLSFGLGVFGLLCLAAVVVWLLRHPLWRRRSIRFLEAGTMEEEV